MNQMDNFQDKEATESLTDLPLTDEQAEETKGGSSTASRTTISSRESNLTYSGESGGLNQ